MTTTTARLSRHLPIPALAITALASLLTGTVPARGVPPSITPDASSTTAVVVVPASQPAGAGPSALLQEAAPGSAQRPDRQLPPVNNLVPNFYYDDVDAAKRWYVDKLGFRMVIDLGWVAIVEVAPGMQVALVDGERGTLDAVADKGALLVIETDALEQWHEHVSAVEGIQWYEYDPDPRRTLRDDGIMEHPEIEEFRIVDPGGYIIEFFRWKPEFAPQ